MFNKYASTTCAHNRSRDKKKMFSIYRRLAVSEGTNTDTPVSMTSLPVQTAPPSYATCVNVEPTAPNKDVHQSASDPTYNPAFIPTDNSAYNCTENLSENPTYDAAYNPSYTAAHPAAIYPDLQKY